MMRKMAAHNFLFFQILLSIGFLNFISSYHVNFNAIKRSGKYFVTYSTAFFTVYLFDDHEKMLYFRMHQSARKPSFQLIFFPSAYVRP